MALVEEGQQAARYHYINLKAGVVLKDPAGLPLSGRFIHYLGAGAATGSVGLDRPRLQLLSRTGEMFVASATTGETLETLPGPVGIQDITVCPRSEFVAFHIALTSTPAAADPSRPLAALRAGSRVGDEEEQQSPQRIGFFSLVRRAQEIEPFEVPA